MVGDVKNSYIAAATAATTAQTNAVTALTTARNAQALAQFGVALYSSLTAAQQTSVNASGSVVTATANVAGATSAKIVADAKNTAFTSGAMLNVQVKLPDTAIKLGTIYVANSNAAPDDYDADGNAAADADTLDNHDGDGITVASKIKILDGLEIVLAAADMTIQLGSEDANEHMIQANSTLVGGLTLNNFALYDEDGAAATTVSDLMLGNTPTSGGSVRASSIKIVNNDGSGNLTTVTGIDVGSRISATPATVPAAAKDGLVNILTSGAFTTFTDLSTATGGATAATANANAAAAATSLSNARNADAVTQFGPGSTYAGLTVAQKATVDSGAVVAPLLTASNNANTLVGLVTVRDSADYRQGSVEAAAAAPGNWGGVDTYNGLVITSQMGGAAGVNMSINNLALGDTNASVMGDIEIIGLRLGTSKIVIMGH